MCLAFLKIGAIASVTLVLGTLAAAQTTPSTDASAQTTQPVAEPMRVIVVEVQGNVRVRSNREQDWQPATVEMVLGEDAEFRTGPRSSVTCAIPPDQTFTLDRLGTVSVLEAVREGKTVKTDLALKYGRIKFDIEAAGVDHRAVIRSPSSTLAVRGTNVTLYDQPPFAPQAQSFTGRAMFGYAKRQFPVGGKSYARIVAGSGGAAETAIDASVIDPRYALARSESDDRLIANEVSRGAVLFYDPVANINVIKNGAGPLPDSQFALNPPGPLTFYLRWPGNADLNMSVTLQAGNALDIFIGNVGVANFQPTDFLYPGYSLNNTVTGGHIPFDNRGGPNGGTETGYWNKLIPGLYGISARNISGETTTFKFNAILQGSPTKILTQELTLTDQLERTLAPGEEIVGLVPVPRDPLFDAVFPPEGAPAAATASVAAKAKAPVKTSVKATQATRKQSVQARKTVRPVTAVPAAPAVPKNKATQ